MIYLTRSAAAVEGYALISSTSDTVICPEHDAPTASGILDANGDMLYRVPERVKFGFDLSRKEPIMATKKKPTKRGGRGC